MTTRKSTICDALLILAAAAMAGCGSGQTPTGDVQDVMVDDTRTDATTDLAADAATDTNDRDGATDTTDTPTCAEMIQNDAIMRLFADEGQVIVHVNAAFDGQALWMAWSALDENDPLDPDDDLMTIRAARMACDGTILVQPFDVDPDNAGNSYEAEIAVANGNVLIAWHQDYQGYYTKSATRIGVPGDGMPNRTPPAEDVIEPADATGDTTWDATDDVATSDASDDIAADVAADATADTADVIETDATEDAAPQDIATDVPTFPNDNMRVYYRTFKVDGTPLMTDGARRYLPEVDGTEAAVNNWIPRVAALPDGNFVISSAWAWPGGNSFQAVAQRFDADGNKVGGLIHPYPQPLHDETYTDLAVDSQGNIHLSWGDTEFIDGVQQETRIANVTIPPDSNIPAENSPVFFETAGDNPSLGATPADMVFTAWMTSDQTPDIAVTARTADASATGSTVIRNSGWYDTYPMISTGPSGAAVVWYKWTTDTKVADPIPPTSVMFSKLAWNGTGDITTIGDAIVVNPAEGTNQHNALQYYEPVVVDVGSGRYFIMWTERWSEVDGETGDRIWHFDAYGRFLKP